MATISERLRAEITKGIPVECDAAEYVRSILDYDPDTGVFTWKCRADARSSWNTRFAGKEAGSVLSGLRCGRYRYIGINLRHYKAHRLAWLIVTGAWPEDEIDHIDGDGLNNVFSNLRPATRTENNRNCRTNRTNTSGLKGACWHKRYGRWAAQIRVDGRQRHLGYFDTPEAAHAAYCAAAEKYHGEFARVA